jgi:hypothetical protein
MLRIGSTSPISEEEHFAARLKCFDDLHRRLRYEVFKGGIG